MATARNSVTKRGEKPGPPRARNPSHTGPLQTSRAPSAPACAGGCCLPAGTDDDPSAADSKHRKRFLQRRNQQRKVLGLVVASGALALALLALAEWSGVGVRFLPSRLSLLPFLASKGSRRNPGRNPRRNPRGYLDPSLDDDDAWGDDDYPKHDRVVLGNGHRHRDGHRHKQAKKHGHKRKKKREDSEDEPEEVSNPEEVMRRRLAELEELNERMVSNTNTSIRWADMSDVPALPGTDTTKQEQRNKLLFDKDHNQKRYPASPDHKSTHRKFYQVHRPEAKKMAWEIEFDAIPNKDPKERSTYVDYVHHEYEYPPQKLSAPPSRLGDYPILKPYREIMKTWPQDNLDDPPPVLKEYLQHFDWNVPSDMEAALKFRTAKLPFKLINVPEVLAATQTWTDDYLADQFDGTNHSGHGNLPRSNGKCNEGPDNFFAFFNVPLWDVLTLGIPPTRDNDWTFRRWANHAHYADRFGISPHLPHYYWQSGVPRDERYQHPKTFTFVSRDLPSFASTEANFVQWVPDAQKGIQCRFGERGITAANHYDSGRNMIAMITGAKRYILSPPRECKKLGIVSSKGHSSFRHSMLNYGHMALLDDRKDPNAREMPPEEAAWMEMAGTAEAVSTVVKEGEILYVPTGWFHYITSLQKSAQCNVRSGPDTSGDPYFGGARDIRENCFPHE